MTLPPAVERFLAGSAKLPLLLMLDYDGTLAPFHEDRRAAVPWTGIRERLVRLARRPATWLAVVSGRPVEEVATLLALDPPAEIFGEHGRVRRRRCGAVERQEIRAELDAALTGVARTLADLGYAGWLERKGGSLAVHWRGRPAAERERLLLELAGRVLPAAEEAGLSVLAFAAGIELRAPGVTKADAVRTLLAESPVGAVPVYIGDDATDEEAFAALPAGGLGVLAAGQDRPTRASVRLNPPEQLLELFDRLLAPGAGEGAR